MLAPTLREAFFQHCKLTQAEVLDRVYRQPFPNRFLSSLSPFLLAHIDDTEIRQLVRDSFISFIKRNIHHYDYASYEVSCVGSIAYYYEDVLREAATATDIRIRKIVRSPMEGLIGYYG